MVDALLVFSPLQETCFFVLRSPYFDRIGVAPLLRRRLLGLQSLYFSLSSHCTFSAGLPKYVSSLRLLLFYVLFFLPYGNLYNPLAFLFALAFRLKLRFFQASYAASLRTYLLSLSLRFFTS
jgi:uncharacterized membrane protein